MKNIIAFLTLLFFCIAAYPQKQDTANKTQDKDKTTNAGDNKVSKEDHIKVQEKQNQDTVKTNKQPQETRYTTGNSGVRRSINYKFSKSVQDTDPGNGIFRYSSDTISNVKWIFIDNDDLSGEDQSNWYKTWDDTTGATGRGSVNLVKSEENNINAFNFTGVFIKEEGYWKFPVEFISGDMPAEGASYYFIFNRIAHKKPQQAHSEEPAKVLQPVAEALPVTEQPQVPVSSVVQPSQPVQEVQPAVEEKPPVQVAEVVEQPQPVQEVKPVIEEKPPVQAAEIVQQPQPVQEVKPVIEERPPVQVAEIVQQPQPVQEVKPVIEEKPPVQAVEIVQQPQPVQQSGVVQKPQPEKEPLAQQRTKPVTAQRPQQTTTTTARPATQANETQARRTGEPAQPAQTTQTKQPVQANQTTFSKPIVQTTTQPAQQTQKTQAAQTTKPVQQTQTYQPAPYNHVSQINKTADIPNPYANLTTTGTTAHRKCYRGIIELGYALGLGDYWISNFRFNLINGIMVGRSSSVGLGIGYRRYFTESFADRKLYSPVSQVPVFLDLRTSFTTKKVTPYLALGLGGSASFIKESSDSVTTRHEGFYFCPSGGIWLNLSERFALFAGIAFEMQRLEYILLSDDSHFKKNSGSLSLNIGIAF